MLQNLRQLEARIQERYNAFFAARDIDPVTGLTTLLGKQFRFASLPHIGEEYPHAKRKILFVAHDMGSDETTRPPKTPADGHIQYCDERRRNVCSAMPNDLNPHMSGTYVTALYFLKNDHEGWAEVYGKISATGKQFQPALKQVKDLPEEVLSKIAMTNYHKYVVANQHGRTGDKGRVPALFRETVALLAAEINDLNPDVVIFTGPDPREELLREIRRAGREIYRGYHPSVIGRYIKYRIPANYMANLKRI